LSSGSLAGAGEADALAMGADAELDASADASPLGADMAGFAELESTTALGAAEPLARADSSGPLRAGSHAASVTAKTTSAPWPREIRPKAKRRVGVMTLVIIEIGPCHNPFAALSRR
jgi:hypothetical protein